MEPPPSPPVQTTPPVTALLRNTGNDKIWSILSHVSVFLGVGFLVLPLVVYLAMKDESEYVAANAKEALNFHISWMIYYFCCIPLCLIMIGFLLFVLLTLSMFILSILAAIKASDGGCYRYPMTLRLVK
jgi:hypothetical protein